MKRVLWFLLVCTLACSQKAQRTDVPVEKLSWHERMQQLSESLTTLIPYVINDKKFADASNNNLLKSEAKRFSQLAHSLENMKPPADADPSLRFVSRNFSQDLRHATEALDQGEKVYARKLMRGAINNCIACHTRNSRGTQNFTLNLTPNLESMRLVERAEYHTAIRQFGKAMDEFDNSLTQKEIPITDTREWELAAKKLLAITVRVKQDPSDSLEVVSRFFDAEAVPEDLKKAAKQWRRSILDWRTQERKNLRPVTNPSQLLSLSKNLVKKADTQEQSLPQSGLINYLRASTLLNDVLNSNAKKSIQGEALYYAGIVAEQLADVNLWTMKDGYFEACIRIQPKTKFAQECYTKFEEGNVGRSTRGRAAFPPYEANYLNTLRQIAY